MIKTIVIMAAGKGTRMLPLTEKVPKSLIKVNGKPFLQYILNNVKKAGYEKIIVIGNYKIGQLKEFLDKDWVGVILVNQGAPKGSGHAVLQVKDFVDGDFVVINGDSLFSPKDLRKIRDVGHGNYIVGMKSDTPEKYGVLMNEGNKLVKIVEKPKEFVGDLVGVGIYRFTKEIFSVLERLKPSSRGEYEIVDAINSLTKKGLVNVRIYNGLCMDITDAEDLKAAEQSLKGK